MENVKKMNFNERFRDQSKQLALEVIMLYSQLKSREELRILGKQLIRCGTSVAANFRAAVRARSSAEYYSKLCIVVEECDETLFWLELIDSTGFIKSPKIQELMKKTAGLLAVFAKTRKAIKERYLK